ILDPILIFGLGLGVMGASLATALSQLVSFCALLYLAGKNGGLSIDYHYFKPQFWHYEEINAGGLPSLARQGLGSVATICLNRIAGGYGDAILAAFSIVNRYIMFVASILLGYGQGFQPVCGFNYGAKKYERVQKAFWFTVLVGTIYCCIMAVLSFAFSPIIVSLFRKGDPDVISYGARILRYQALALPLMSFTVVTNMYLQTIKRPVMASIVAMARQGIVFLPVLFLLNALLGLQGAMMAQAISDVLALVLAAPMCFYALSWMMKKKD
ncbi:MAG: MATE family efflux transporter, partial [Spirochaetales bacterium]|nr:MATE family efflux transporter [Candidatus Physcosoma equi]